MYYNLIKTYITNITKNDITNYLEKENINLTDYELDIIFNTIKLNWETIYNGNEDIIYDLKNYLTSENYNKLINLYINKKDYYKL